MNKCKRCRSLFLEYFYGGLDADRKKFFDDHLSACPKCRAKFQEMESVLQFTGKRVRPEPPQEVWDSFENKLAKKIEREESLERKQKLPKEKPFLFVPKWAYQGAAAVAILVLGVFIGKALFSPSSRGVQQLAQQLEPSSETQPEISLVHRSQNYIERSKLILLALVNFDPSVEDPYALNLPYQRQISRELVQEASSLKQELAESDQERLENLINSLELILLQIANLESQNDLEAIRLVRDGIDRRGILMEINLTDLRLAMKPTKQKPKTM